MSGQNSVFGGYFITIACGAKEKPENPYKEYGAITEKRYE